MATTKELEARISELESLLAGMGVIPHPKPEKNYDHLDFGSPDHAAFLGLILLKSLDEAENRMTYKSPTTGQLYCLEDEVTQFMQYPDPKQVAQLVLRQKVNVFEGGAPPIPVNAPPLWVPVDQGIA